METVDIEKNKIKICCEGCSKHLMNIIVVNDNPKVTRNIQAQCPFCEIGSEIKKIVGQFYIGPAVKEETKFPTVIENMDFLEEKTVFIIKKAL